MSKENVITEMVLYKIKPEHIGNFPEEILPEMRNAIVKMKGFISYKTFKGIKQEGYFMDVLKWDTLENAQIAGQEIRERTEKGEFPLIMSSFEKIEFFDHFNLIS